MKRTESGREAAQAVLSGNDIQTFGKVFQQFSGSIGKHGSQWKENFWI